MDEEFIFVFLCIYCVLLLFPFFIAILIYRDARRNFDPNALVWSVLGGFFPIPVIFIYLFIRKQALSGLEKEDVKTQKNIEKESYKSGPIERY
jgi:RsiW-degrading membrane proteinase PrsW (M82 family)